VLTRIMHPSFAQYSVPAKSQQYSYRVFEQEIGSLFTHHDGGAFVLPDVSEGKMEASITRSASRPCMRRRLSTTDDAGSGTHAAGTDRMKHARSTLADIVDELAAISCGANLNPVPVLRANGIGACSPSRS